MRNSLESFSVLKARRAYMSPVMTIVDFKPESGFASSTVTKTDKATLKDMDSESMDNYF